MSTTLNERSKPSKTASRRPRCSNLLNLLFAALPTIVFGVFTVVFTLQQDASAKATREQDQRQADEVNRRQIFKEYIDDMAELLLHEDFERNISKSLLHIRVQTLTALKHLDAGRKHDVIVFLYENRLIYQGEPHLVRLHGADLRGMKFIKSSNEHCDFPYLYLPGVYAENIIFRSCLLVGAVFDKASMTGARFDSCNVYNGSFVGANLTGARIHDNHLFNASFADAHLARTSIQGGVFQQVNLTNVDLYQSDISDSLLYPMAVSGLGPNVILNSRFPNGSMSDIDTGDVVENGRAQTQVCPMVNHFYLFVSSRYLQCHCNSTPFWRKASNSDPVSIIDSTQLAPEAMGMVKDDCFFKINSGQIVGNHLAISKFSLLIDLEQAILNFSALIGLKQANDKDKLTIFVHFAAAEGSFDYMRSLKRSIQPASFFELVSAVHPIPTKTKMLGITIHCEAISSDDQFCLFSNVQLFISKKTY